MNNIKKLLIEFEQPLAQWTVYPGQTISKEEIDILCNKKGQFLISLNGFLSTSRKIDIADCYSKEVIFIIQTTFDLSHGCFAHVALMSQFSQEDEVLFDLASVFKIVDMNYDQINDKWNIYLVTTDEGTNVVQAYINSAKNEANETNVDFIFVRLLIQMGEYNLAQDYLTKLTTIISCENENRDLALAYYYKGLNLYREGNYSQSMIEYEKTLPSDYAEICITHHNLDQVYRAKEQGSQLALKHYQKAIDIYMKSLPRQHPYIGLSLMYIGEVLCDQDNLQDALQYAQEALDILEITLSKEHRRLAESAYTLAKIYKKMNQNHKSLEYAYKAQDIQLKTLNIDQNDVQKTIELINSIKIANNI